MVKEKKNRHARESAFRWACIAFVYRRAPSATVVSAVAAEGQTSSIRWGRLTEPAAPDEPAIIAAADTDATHTDRSAQCLASRSCTCALFVCRSRAGFVCFFFFCTSYFCNRLYALYCPHRSVYTDRNNIGTCFIDARRSRIIFNI